MTLRDSLVEEQHQLVEAIVWFRDDCWLCSHVQACPLAAPEGSLDASEYESSWLTYLELTVPPYLETSHGRTTSSYVPYFPHHETVAKMHEVVPGRTPPVRRLKMRSRRN